MTCEFVKSARAAAIAEGLDPRRISCTNRQTACIEGQGCADMQDVIEAEVQKPMFVFPPGVVHPKVPLAAFNARLERTATFVHPNGSGRIQ